MRSLLDLVKQNNEDFEWYPTTNEMLEVLMKRIVEIREEKHLSTESMLDIGAGDGRVLKYFDKDLRLDNIHAIEKSRTLIDSMDRNILVVGSDFNQTSLIEKTYDLVFCNPPYSSYKEWVMRILRETNSMFIALVIPSRWQQDSDIKRVIESRKGLEYEVLESTDFLNAERSARAKVDIVLFKTIRATDKNAKYGVVEDVFADNLIKQFKLQKLFDDIDESEYDDKKRHTDELEEKTYQVANGDLIEFLVSEYGKEYNEFLESLNHLNAINSELLKCMNVDKKKLIKGIKSKIRDLKNLYWKELFSKLQAIRSRVTSTYAGYIHESVIVENNVDFNKDNIYSVVLWVIKNADKYIEKSYLSFFERMAQGENVLYYKSNQRFNIDNWRYANREDKSRTPNPYKLDYRIVLPRVAYAGYSGRFYHDEDWTNFLIDLKVIGRNLGFFTENIALTRFDGISKYMELSNNCKPLFEVKQYKNGNAHIKFSMEFMEKLNIQVGRINNWIKNKAEAREEFKNISDEELDYLFEKPIGISVGDSVKMLKMF